LYQKAPILIAVEVGTSSVFENGIRVRDFTVPGVLIRLSSKFPINSTQRRDDFTWAFQTLRFRIYPQRSGELIIPKLTTLISIISETYGLISGEISLDVPPLNIDIPQGTEELNSWVAAKEFSIEETWEGELDSYEIGDAVTRTRIFSIKGAPGMAIPASSEQSLTGMKMYIAPELVNDKSVGGALDGVREERVVFTVKSGGSLTIPDENFYWFDLNTQVVKIIEMPGRILKVSGTQSFKDWFPQDLDSLNWLFAIVGVILSVFLLRQVLLSTGYNSLNLYAQKWREQRRNGEEFKQAVLKQDSHKCISLLYKRMSVHSEWQLNHAFAKDSEFLPIIDALMAHAYGNGSPPDPNSLYSLWKMSIKTAKQTASTNKLRLNPTQKLQD
jgi:hypothetical protein